MYAVMRVNTKVLYEVIATASVGGFLWGGIETAMLQKRTLRERECEKWMG